ncbi:MAG TPA: hypothetical protein VKU02_10355 [Gemmataceae bacterium]|nr:hypothetical protein [Gemmataceae bacterium]
MECAAGAREVPQGCRGYHRKDPRAAHQKYLGEVTARELFRAIGRKPSTGRSLTGAVAAKAGEALAGVVRLAGSAQGNWKDLQQLLLEGLDALGALAIAEQLRYALALPELAEPAFRIVAEKQKDQLLIEEYMPEMGAVALLLHGDA